MYFGDLVDDFKLPNSLKLDIKQSKQSTSLPSNLKTKSAVLFWDTVAM